LSACIGNEAKKFVCNFATLALQRVTTDTVIVLPDGCRDLIFKHSSGQKPLWFVSDLAAGCSQVNLQPLDYYNGFRLQPGVRLDQAGLLASLETGLDDAAIKDRLESFTKPVANVRQALDCLSGTCQSVAKAAAALGVHPRSLQRLLKRETAKPPAFWLRLARVRKAVARISPTGNLAALAYDLGFSDQPHMTREFRHWFNATPNQIKQNSSWCAQNLGLGYGV